MIKIASNTLLFERTLNHRTIGCDAGFLGPRAKSLVDTGVAVVHYVTFTVIVYILYQVYIDLSSVYHKVSSTTTKEP